MSPSASSAEPQKLLRYSDRATWIDQELLSESNHLGGALQRFQAACREYPISVSGLDGALRDWAQRAERVDLWVRGVGRAFQQADAMESFLWSGAVRFRGLPSLPQIAWRIAFRPLPGSRDLPEWLRDKLIAAGVLSANIGLTSLFRLHDWAGEQIEQYQGAPSAAIDNLQGTDTVTLEQMREIEARYHVDLSEDGLEDTFRGMTQSELRQFLDDCGLESDVTQLENPGAHFQEADYSVNQQLLVLAAEYGPGSIEFAQGREFIESVDSGSVLSFHRGEKGGILSKLIAVGTSLLGVLAPSHSAIGVGKGVFVEALSTGIQATRAVDEYMNNLEKGHMVQVQKIPGGLTSEQRSAISDNAYDRIGEPYNFIGVLTGYADPYGKSKYCSELAYDVLQESGVDIVASPENGPWEEAIYGLIPEYGQHMVDQRVSPQDLNDATMRNGDALVRVYDYTDDTYERSGIVGAMTGTGGSKGI